MIQCSECKAQISARASACSSCGEPRRKSWLENPLLQMLLSASVAAAMVGACVDYRVSADLLTLESNRTWEEQSLERVLGPARMLLERTRRLSQRDGSRVPIDDSRGLTEGKRWHLSDAILLQSSNRELRDLFLYTGHLMPLEVREAAHCFIEHSDDWLDRAATPIAEGLAARRASVQADSVIIPSIPDSILGCRGFPDGKDAIIFETFDRLQNRLYDLGES